MIDTQQLHAIVHGRVQGVGFRNATQTRAEGFGLTGWVRNRSDGTVEVLAEGPRTRLQDFLEWLERGPVGAHVTRVEIEWLDRSQDLHDFEIRFSM
jgi:acylphosphatase